MDAHLADAHLATAQIANNVLVRISKIVSVVALLLLIGASGCKTLRIDSNGALQTVSVMAENRNYVEYSLPDSLTEMWSYNAEAGFGQVGPLLFDDFVLVATRRGEVHIVDSQSGKKIGSKKFGNAINGSPALEKERMYVPVDYGGKKGIRAWDLRLGSRLFDVVSVAVETAIVNLGDRIVFVDTKSVVRCVDGADGSDIWSIPLNPRFAVAASPILVNERLMVVVNTNGNGVAIDYLSGRSIGEFAVAGAVYNGLSTDGMDVLVPTVSGRLFAVDVATLDVEVVFKTDDETVQVTTAAISDDMIVVAGSDGIVRAVARDGFAPKWETDVEFPVVAAPFIAGSHVYVATLGRTLVSLATESGSRMSEHTLGGRVKSPMNVHENALYVLSEPRNLYRFSGNANYVADHNSSR